jgi:hypothetical protein
MSAKNRKLVDFYEEQGGERGDNDTTVDHTSWVNPEQMRRAEERMARAGGPADTNVSEVGPANGTTNESSGGAAERVTRRDEG